MTTSSKASLYRVAVDELEQFLDLAPGPVYAYITGATVQEDDDILDWDRLCQLHFPDTDYAHIMYIIESATQRFSGNAYIHAFRARALWAVDGYDEAVKELERALTIQPYYDFAQWLLGETYYLSGRLEQAHVALNICILRNPLFSRTYFARALTRERLAETKPKDMQMFYYTLALNDLDKAQQLSPDFGSHFQDVRARINQKAAIL